MSEAENQLTFTRKTGIILMYPGQGQQYGPRDGQPGMFDGFDDHPLTRRLMNDAKIVTGADFRSFGDEEIQKQGQPANVIAAIGAGLLIRSLLVRDPDAYTGDSLGALPAAFGAGAVSLNETIWMAVERDKATNRAMRELGRLGIEGAMAAIMNIDRQHVIEICKELGSKADDFVRPANFKGSQTVISGSKAKVEAFRNYIATIPRTKFIPLNVPGAFHSMHMRFAAKPYSKSLARVDFMPFNAQLLSMTTNDLLRTPQAVRDDLIAQLTEPVLFDNAQDSIAASVERSSLEHLILAEAGAYSKSDATTEQGVVTDLNRRRFKTLTLLNKYGDVVRVDFVRVGKPADIEEGTHAHSILAGQ